MTFCFQLSIWESIVKITIFILITGFAIGEVKWRLQTECLQDYNTSFVSYSWLVLIYVDGLLNSIDRVLTQLLFFFPFLKLITFALLFQVDSIFFIFIFLHQDSAKRPKILILNQSRAILMISTVLNGHVHLSFRPIFLAFLFYYESSSPWPSIMDYSDR